MSLAAVGVVRWVPRSTRFRAAPPAAPAEARRGVSMPTNPYVKPAARADNDGVHHRQLGDGKGHRAPTSPYRPNNRTM